jgi:dihydroorotate dehydrogenase
LPSEFSHFLALEGLRIISLLGFKIKDENHNQSNLIGISFSNKLGLAAGLDKNGDYIDCLASLGFGFLEIGTVTPKPQKGNPKPRLFRLKGQKALVNKMGFNNKGVDYLVFRVKKKNVGTTIGISIGKNFDTPLESAIDDYLMCLNKVYEVADYVAINISSPNTKNLRNLQSKNYINTLLSTLKARQLELAEYSKYTPILIKISPDMTYDELQDLALSALQNNIDGIICSNTSTQHSYFSGEGGLSGRPLFQSSTDVLEILRGIVGKDFLIIASGGVMDLESYNMKIDKGADLVQIYTGFVFEGPYIVNKIINSVSKN